jgi:hypothetical protein
MRKLKKPRQPLAKFQEGPAGESDREAELMQYRIPVGGGPSSKTCPKCEPHRAQCTSVRRTNQLVSLCVPTFSGLAGAQKLGQPVPESNFVSDPKRSWPHPTHRYTPGVFVSQ